MQEKGIRATWLFQVVTAFQPLASTVFVPCLGHQTGIDACLKSMPAPITPIERLVLRGLWIELAVRADPAACHLVRVMLPSLFPTDDLVCRRHVDGIGADVSPAKSAKLLIDRNFGMPLTILGLSRRVGMSRNALVRAFKAAFSIPIREYITSVRVNAAIARITTSDEKIDRVAAEVGFRSRAAFSRRFLRQVGCPPGIFRRRARAQERLQVTARNWATEHTKEPSEHKTHSR